MGIFEIFDIFDPMETAEKWELGLFLKLTPRNIPNDARKSEQYSTNALGIQINRPENVKKCQKMGIFEIFDIFNPLEKA